MAIIEISNVSKMFGRRGVPGRKARGKFYALKDISLVVEQGDILGVLGPNGAGKTTLLNIVMGLIYPDSGSVRIFGGDLRKDEIVKKIGYVSGEERFHWSLSAYDILTFGGILYGLGRVVRKERVSELLATFELEKVASSKFDVLSTGEKMRIAFAYALINNPKLLLLDEPTLGLDPDIAIKVRKEILRINRLGTTIVLTSHYMREVEQLCNRIAFIKGGRLLQVGRVSEIRKKFPSLEKYFIKMAGEEEA